VTSTRWYWVAGLDELPEGRVTTVVAGVGSLCLTCSQMVTDYLDEALPARVRAAFDRHLAECPGCTSTLEQWRVVIRLGGRLGEEDVDAVDPSVREALLDAFR
jgi:Putative zinc-finger